MIAPEAGLSVFYYRPRPDRAAELELLERVDRIFTDHPVYGSRRLQVALAAGCCEACGQPPTCGQGGGNA